MKSKNYITISEEGHIHLTEEGKILAETVYERHSLLCNWLIKMGVDPEIASNDACKMEHDISSESFSAIKNFIELHAK